MVEKTVHGPNRNIGAEKEEMQVSLYSYSANKVFYSNFCVFICNLCYTRLQVRTI